MSGVGGWHKTTDTSTAAPDRPRDFDAARKAYDIGAGRGTTTRVHHIGDDSSHRKSTISPPITLTAYLKALHALKSNAPNVLIGVHDVTGSMGKVPKENFKRLPLLYRDGKKYLGEAQKFEMLFMAYGDATAGDTYPLQVPPRFEAGPELDKQLASLYIEGGGGGGRRESAELAAYHLLKQVDVTSAQNCHVYFMTDEKGYDRVDPTQVKNLLGLDLDPKFTETKEVFRVLRQRMKIFVILYHTDEYDGHDIKAWWVSMLGAQNVITLDDYRRTVDVILGVSAATVGKSELFTADLTSRHHGSAYAAVNVSTVLTSVSRVATPGGKLGPIKVIPPGRKSILLLGDGSDDPDAS